MQHDHFTYFDVTTPNAPKPGIILRVITALRAGIARLRPARRNRRKPGASCPLLASALEHTNAPRFAGQFHVRG